MGRNGRSTRSRTAEDTRPGRLVFLWIARLPVSLSVAARRLIPIFDVLAARIILREQASASRELRHPCEQKKNDKLLSAVRESTILRVSIVVAR